jgi:hypothetical protein
LNIVALLETALLIAAGMYRAIPVLDAPRYAANRVSLEKQSAGYSQDQVYAARGVFLLAIRGPCVMAAELAIRAMMRPELDTLVE